MIDLNDFTLISEKERIELVDSFNATQSSFPQNKTLQELFEDQVVKTPGKIAIVDGDIELTYKELNEKSNEVSYFLRTKSMIKPDQPIAVLMERSAGAIIVMMGILKSGGAYVPIDTSFPEERIKFTLSDTEVELCFIDKVNQIRHNDIDLEDICKIRTLESILEKKLSKLNLPSNSPGNAAYIIYTSGSTGRPKGVIIEHRNLVNYIHWANSYYFNNKSGYNFPLFTSLSFDLTVTSIFSTLLRGDTVYVFGGMEINETLRKIFHPDSGVSAIKLTPSHISLIQSLNLRETNISHAIVGGEALTQSQVKTLLRINPDIRIFNEYGPTETTVGCTIAEISGDHKTIIIGKPIANSRIYILDEKRQLVPKGVIGEIYIGGEGVARGYLNQSELSREKFIADPFLPEGRCYRSGDMGRWLPDGNIELFGRKDSQIKLRGYRIELEEVEKILSDYPGILGSTVALKEIRFSDQHHSDSIRQCITCGIPSNYPRIQFDEKDVCSICRSYEEKKAKVSDYFKTPEDLEKILTGVRENRVGEYDCLVLFSGGKDSTYVLCQLVRKHNLKVLTFTLDNGFISEEAKTNVRKVTDALGVDHIFGTTQFMNEIFVDSLQRHHNVCDGCFKTIYTLAYKMAREKNIKCIVTGLSRGQLFETRLHQMYDADIFDPVEIDRNVLTARKAYYKLDDAVTRNLSGNLFEDGSMLEEIQMVDFFRYTDVELAEMYEYLGEYIPWVRPSDTGRSTNCLINNAGIFIHTKLRGYHNYALPYSWDVRIGHKIRNEALEELDDEIDEVAVRNILDEIGYTEPELPENNEKHLVAYYTSKTPIDNSEIKAFLAKSLPEYMIPFTCIRLDSLPLTINGKVDRKQLPEIDLSQLTERPTFRAAGTKVEEKINQLWEEILRMDKVGIDDNFFELGGSSIKIVVLFEKICQLYDSTLKLTDLFEFPTISGQANLIENKRMDKGEKTPEFDVLEF